MTSIGARRSLLALAAAVVLACAPESQPTVNPPPPPTDPPATTLPATTVTITDTTLPLATACPPGDVMLADGRLLHFERPNVDATRIAGINWRVTGNCQLISVVFATADGAPATTPPTITARLLRSAGVLRIDTQATESVIVDQIVEEGMIDRLFVPLTPEETRFIDLVLDGPVVARARVLTSPARLEVELEPGGPEIGSPLVSPELVLIAPGSAAEAEPILDITGYSIGELDALNVSVLLGDAVIEETTFELESQPDSWTAFNLILPMGNAVYDSLRVTTDDGSVVAGIPFSR